MKLIRKINFFLSSTQLYVEVAKFHFWKRTTLYIFYFVGHRRSTKFFLFLGRHTQFLKHYKFIKDKSKGHTVDNPCPFRTRSNPLMRISMSFNSIRHCTEFFYETKCFFLISVTFFSVSSPFLSLPASPNFCRSFSSIFTSSMARFSRNSGVLSFTSSITSSNNA